MDNFLFRSVNMDNFQQKNNQEQKNTAGSICKSGTAQESAGSCSAGENKKEKQTQKAKVSALPVSCSDRFNHRDRPHYQRMLWRRNGRPLRHLGSGRHHRLCV